MTTIRARGPKTNIKTQKGAASTTRSASKKVANETITVAFMFCGLMERGGFEPPSQVAMTRA